MGYLIAGHLLANPAAFERLTDLPPDLAYRVHAHEQAAFWGIETFSHRGDPGWPPYTQSVPVRIGSRPGAVLEAGSATLAAALRAYADGGGMLPEWHAILELGLTISSLLDARVFTFMADDDVNELSATCERGALVRARGRVDGFELSLAADHLEVRPVPEEELPDHVVTGFFTGLRDVRGVALEAPSGGEDEGRRLHGFVLDGLAETLPAAIPALGVGSFDAEPCETRVLAERLPRLRGRR